MDYTALLGYFISGFISLVICLINSNAQQRKSDHDQDKRMIELQAALNQSIAVIDCRIEQLTSEVAKHNNFAQRMPVVEEQIRVINKRIADLEAKIK